MINLHWGLIAVIVFAAVYFGFFMACLFTVAGRSDKTRRKRVYIAHPFNGLIENIGFASLICRKVIEKGYLPISPIHLFLFLNDSIPEEREKALELCKELVLTCDELWLCGDWQNSEGCKMELQMALDHGIPIIYYADNEMNIKAG